jgi:hypothetical protein
VRVVLGHREKRRGARRGAVENGGALPLYRGRGGGRRQMIKMEKWPVINRSETTQFKWGLVRRVKSRGWGNGQRMRCRARGSGSTAGEARAALAGAESRQWRCSSILGGRRKKSQGWAMWAERPNKPAGRLDQNLKRNSFLNKN